MPHKEEELRIGIVGVGAMGRYHHRACRESSVADIVAICDPDHDAATRLDPRLPVFREFGDLIASGTVEAVIINTPHYLHDSMAIAALDAGLHVLVEKPMAVSTARCDEMLAASRRSGAHLAVGHIQHHMPDKVAAKEFVDAGHLGELVSMVDARTTPYEVRSRPAWFYDQELAGGGVLFNIGAHCVDRTAWLADAEVSEVSAWTRHRFGLPIETDGVMNLTLSTGIPVSISVTSNSPAETELLTVAGTKGTLVASPHTGVQVSRGGKTTELLGHVPDPFRDACLRQIYQFVKDAKSAGAESNAIHARHVVEVLQTAYESAAAGSKRFSIGYRSPRDLVHG